LVKISAVKRRTKRPIHNYIVETSILRRLWETLL
jgi:hypothetical protein